MVKTLRDDLSLIEQRYNKAISEQAADHREQMQSLKAQHTAEIQDGMDQRNRIDEKYKSDLNERNTRNYEAIADLKRDHQDALNALHKQLEENRAELTKVITQYEDKQRQEDEAHKNSLVDNLGAYSKSINLVTEEKNAFQVAKTAEVGDLTAKYDADRRNLQE